MPGYVTTRSWMEAHSGVPADTRPPNINNVVGCGNLGGGGNTGGVRLEEGQTLPPLWFMIALITYYLLLTIALCLAPGPFGLLYHYCCCLL